MTDIVDVLIVGGGPVGACAAALLARVSNERRLGLSVAVLEPRRPSMPRAGEPVDLRVSSFSRASERVLHACGAWERIRGVRVSPYERMRVWHESVGPTSPQALVFDSAEAAEPNLGYIIENRLVQAALLDVFEESGGRIVAGQLVALRIGEDDVAVQTSAGEIRTRLVVGADGANSAVRDAVGLTVETHPYGQTAIVATVATDRPHERTAWQRFLKSGTLAFLPLADGTSSIVWSESEDTATRLLALPPAEFERELTRAADFALGPTRLLTDRASFPLRRLAAHRYVVHRCALIGDAAHVVHPLAGLGVNLGLLDAAALVDLIVEGCSEREDPGALRLLRRYERWRKSEVQLMSDVIDAFNRFLAHGTGPLSRLAQHGLGWVNRSQELKRFFIGRALGTSGELPSAARSPY